MGAGRPPAEDEDAACRRIEEEVAAYNRTLNERFGGNKPMLTPLATQSMQTALRTSGVKAMAPADWLNPLRQLHRHDVHTRGV